MVGCGRRRGAPAAEQDELALCRAVLDGTVAANHAARTEALAARARAEEAAAREHAMRQAAALRQQREASAAAWAARREEQEAAEKAAAAAAAASDAAPASESARHTDASASTENAAGREAREAGELSEARARYQARWGALLAWAQEQGPMPADAAEVVGIGPAAPPAASLSFGAMPWPSEAWARAWGDASAADLAATDVRRVVLPEGVERGTPAARRALQDELRRWHPDKFVARFGGALREAERDDILDGVKRVSQCLTELLHAEPKAPAG